MGFGSGVWREKSVLSNGWNVYSAADASIEVQGDLDLSMRFIMRVWNGPVRLTGRFLPLSPSPRESASW
jgi:hypothetical protein